MLDLKQLRSFAIAAGASKWRESGIYHRIFQMSDWDLNHTCHTFCYLTNIFLQIHTMWSGTAVT